MFNYHQFHTNKNFNAPPHTGYEASIFPYTGYNQNSPYAQPILIKRAAYSKGTILDYDGQVDDPDMYSLGGYIVDNSALYGGPVPYIYKVKLNGVTTNCPCPDNIKNCNDLNNKEIYLYQHDYNFYNSRMGVWTNTFTDVNNSGIYVDLTPYAGNSDTIYNKLNLSYWENIPDKSTEVFLTVYPFPFNNGDISFDDKPFILHKRFEKNEKIYALMEGFDLTSVDSIQISGMSSPYSPVTINVNTALRRNVCDFTNVTARIEPYNTGMYDIRNNRDTFTNNEWYGIGNRYADLYPTSSGYYPIRFEGIEVYKPSLYKLTMSGVQSNNFTALQVPCSSFFSHDFYLRANEEQYILNDLDSQTSYRWRDYGYSHNTYRYSSNYGYQYDIGLFDLGNLATLPEANSPHLNNINLTLNSRYMQIDLDQGLTSIKFRHDRTSEDYRGVFNNWYLYDADVNSPLEYRCGFGNASLSLESIDTSFNGGKRLVDCGPLCTDYRHPISGSVNLHVSVYEFFDTLVHEFDVNNIKVPIKESDVYWQNHVNTLHYSCDNKIINGFWGKLFFPEETVVLTCSSPPLSPPSPINVLISGVGIPGNFGSPINNQYNEYRMHPTGCAAQMDCNNSYSIFGSEELAENNPTGFCQIFPFGSPIQKYYISVSGQLTFSDFI